MRRRHMAATGGGALCQQKPGHSPLELADNWKRVTCQQCHVRRFLRSKREYDKRKARELARAARPVPLLEETVPEANMHDLQNFVDSVDRQAAERVKAETREQRGPLVYGDLQEPPEARPIEPPDTISGADYLERIETEKAARQKPCDDCPPAEEVRGPFPLPVGLQLEKMQGRLDGLTALLESQQDRLERIHGDLVKLMESHEVQARNSQRRDGYLQQLIHQLQHRFLAGALMKLEGTVDSFFGRRRVELTPRTLGNEHDMQGTDDTDAATPR